MGNLLAYDKDAAKRYPISWDLCVGAAWRPCGLRGGEGMRPRGRLDCLAYFVNSPIVPSPCATNPTKLRLSP
jgi:hypothetical protein